MTRNENKRGLPGFRGTVEAEEVEEEPSLALLAVEAVAAADEAPTEAFFCDIDDSAEPPGALQCISKQSVRYLYDIAYNISKALVSHQFGICTI